MFLVRVLRNLLLFQQGLELSRYDVVIEHRFVPKLLEPSFFVIQVRCKQTLPIEQLLLRLLIQSILLSFFDTLL